MLTTRTSLQTALRQPGFENWTPSVDVLHLKRPRQRPVELDGEGRIAAVLILAFEHLDQTWFVLTRRNPNLSKHAGQISLPGGRQDSGESIEQTALRETHEELGIQTSNVEVLGQLNSVYIPPSDFTVYPFVGWLDQRPNWKPEPNEVAELIEVPMGDLFKKGVLDVGEVQDGDRKITAPFYLLNGHRVWGATALILSELIARCLIAQRENT